VNLISLLNSVTFVCLQSVHFEDRIGRKSKVFLFLLRKRPWIPMCEVISLLAPTFRVSKGTSLLRQASHTNRIASADNKKVLSL
jgi:hypothetical protein